MDNSIFKTDFGKIIEGQKAAINILNGVVSPEIEKMLTPDQLEQIEKARRSVSDDSLRSMAEKLESITKNI